jgi:methyl-CpG-binding domain protein 4
MLYPLGLHTIRAQRLIQLAHKILDTPPDSAILHKTRTPDCPPTPISHLPGVGRYAVDSYRIFVAGGDEWKSVQPADLPLCTYLVSMSRLISSFLSLTRAGQMWKWAVQERVMWLPGEGVVGQADSTYFARLAEWCKYFPARPPKPNLDFPAKPTPKVPNTKLQSHSRTII